MRMETIARTQTPAELVSEFRDRLERLNYAKSTRLQYIETARRFFRVYPEVPLDRLTPEHVEHFLYGLRVSPRTICSRLEELRSFFRWVKDHQRLIDRNPCEGVERPRYKSRL